MVGVFSAKTLSKKPPTCFSASSRRCQVLDHPRNIVLIAVQGQLRTRRTGHSTGGGAGPAAPRSPWNRPNSRSCGEKAPGRAGSSHTQPRSFPPAETRRSWRSPWQLASLLATDTPPENQGGGLLFPLFFQAIMTLRIPILNRPCRGSGAMWKIKSGEGVHAKQSLTCSRFCERHRVVRLIKIVIGFS